MRITKVHILTRGAANPSGTAEAEVELDGMLTLRGFRLRRNRFGCFLAFPAAGTQSLVRLVQPAFARSLRESVLAAFRDHYAGAAA